PFPGAQPHAEVIGEPVAHLSLRARQVKVDGLRAGAERADAMLDAVAPGLLLLDHRVRQEKDEATLGPRVEAAVKQRLAPVVGHLDVLIAPVAYHRGTPLAVGPHMDGDLACRGLPTHPEDQRVAPGGYLDVG